MAEVEGRMAPPSATSATDAALGLRPRRALSSAQLPAEWTTTTLLRNGSSLNGIYPLNFVSHPWGAVHFRPPPPPINAFVANKRLTAIRQGSHKTVEASFSLRFDLEMRSSFCVAQITNFTLWLIPPRGCMLLFCFQRACFSDHGNTGPRWLRDVRDHQIFVIIASFVRIYNVNLLTLISR